MPIVGPTKKMYNLCRIKKVGIDKWIEETKSIREMYSKGEYVSTTVYN